MDHHLPITFCLHNATITTRDVVNDCNQDDNDDELNKNNKLTKMKKIELNLNNTATSTCEQINLNKNVPVIKVDDFIAGNRSKNKYYKNNENTNNGDDNDDDCDVLSNLIGHYGRWQFFWTFFLGLFQCPSTFHIFAFVFQASRKNFWCARPDSMQSMALEEWKNMTVPCGSLNYTALQLYSPELVFYECDQYEYEGDHNIISEWNLVCDRVTLISGIEMCFLAGAALGSICTGWVSDRFGRRHTLMVLVLFQNIFGTLLAFSSSLIIFMILRFLIGFASMGVTMVSFVLVVELVSGKWRTIIGILDLLPVAISYILMAGIAYLTPNWRTTQLVISVPWFLMLLLWFKLPESPRWLLINQRIDELKLIIERAAKWNKIKLPLNYEKMLNNKDDDDDDDNSDNKNNEGASFKELFKSNYKWTTLLMIIVWYSLILLYFGITLHLNNLGGDIYLNTAIAGLLESVSILLCIFVVLKLGIRINLIIYMLIAGVGCLLVNLIPHGNNVGVISLAMIVKCSIGATNALIPTFTAIQYPTSMRTLSVGVGNFAAGFALITVPYLWLLEHIQKNIPMSVMGVFGIIGAFALVFMKDPNKVKSNKLSTLNISSNTIDLTRSPKHLSIKIPRPRNVAAHI